MEPQLLQFIALFSAGLVTGVLLMLLVNKIRSGSAAPKNVQHEYDRYQAEVESHFEETSKKFKQMTEQYQELYQHLSIGATSLCRPDSAAATLADQRSPMDKVVKLDSLADDKPASTPVKASVRDAASGSAVNEKQATAKRADTKADAKPTVKADESKLAAAKSPKNSTHKGAVVSSRSEKKDHGPKKTTL